MDNNYYPAADSEMEGEPSQTPTPEEVEPKESGEEETVLVPLSAFKGKAPEPGQPVSFKVGHVYEDEVELIPVSSKESGGEMESAMSRMDEMASEG